MTKTKQGNRYSHPVKVPGLQTIMSGILPNRTDSEVWLQDTFDVTELLKYLEKKNEGKEKADRTTMFHCILTAVTKMVYERPKMNYYIKTYRAYEREEISLAFVVKKQFTDTAGEELMFYVPKLDGNVDTISSDILKHVRRARKTPDGSGGSVNAVIEKVAALPRFLQIPVYWIVRFLDFWQISPRALTDDDPNFSSVFLTNLGSIKCPSVYHHLNNYGTNSIMIAIGTIHKEKVLMPDGTEEIRDIVDFGATLDERIGDGFYFARSLKLVKYLFAHPEMLEDPINKPSGFDYK